MCASKDVTVAFSLLMMYKKNVHQKFLSWWPQAKLSIEEGPRKDCTYSDDEMS